MTVPSLIASTLLACLICHGVQAVQFEIGSCTSSTAYQTNYCERAYDGDDSTFWGANGISDQWIQLTFAQGPVTVGSFLFLNSENMNENCVRAELQFSDNTKQEYPLETNYQQELQPNWTNKTITSKTTSYVKVTCMEGVVGTYYPSFLEMQFFGTVGTTAAPTTTTTAAPTTTTTTAAPKTDACIVVAVDVSESIMGSGPVTEEDTILQSVWSKLSAEARLLAYNLQVTVLPFNQEALTGEQTVLSTSDYATSAAFVAAESARWGTVRSTLLARGRNELTDLAAMLDQVNGNACSGAKNGVIIISDYVVTQNAGNVQASLNALQSSNIKIASVALNKVRGAGILNAVVAKAAAPLVDMADTTQWDNDLTTAVNALFA